MGSGNIGKATPKPDQTIRNNRAENAGGSRRSGPRQLQMCGAMTQQGTDSHANSQLQEFVRLVGHCEPKVRQPR
jgi:hypothetical protein